MSRWMRYCCNKVHHHLINISAVTKNAGLQSPELMQHSEPFVRRTRLVAASQVLQTIPPARIAGAMLRGNASSDDALWTTRLHTLHSTFESVFKDDQDETCRYVAAIGASVFKIK